MNSLHSRHLSVGYDGQVIVDDLHLGFAPGEITAIVGANGSGKSTLLKAFSRLLKPLNGAVFLDGKDIQATPTRELARRMSIPSIGFRFWTYNRPFTVEDLPARLEALQKR